MADPLWTAAAFRKLDWLAHGVSSRSGGVSQPPYDSLNLGAHVGDRAQDVAENRRRFAAALGLPTASLVTAEQSHGRAVQIVDGPTTAPLPATDALATDRPGLLLLLCFADCLPVLVADPDHQAVGVAHTGWRGLAQGVLPSLIAAMAAAFGTQPQRLQVALGPCIRPCCYPVGDEAAQPFASVPQALRTGVDGRLRLDLERVAVHQLLERGVDKTAIEASAQCTCCDPGYFSYRRDGRTGRFGAGIAIREP